MSIIININIHKKTESKGHLSVFRVSANIQWGWYFKAIGKLLCKQFDVSQCFHSNIMQILSNFYFVAKIKRKKDQACLHLLALERSNKGRLHKM